MTDTKDKMSLKELEGCILNFRNLTRDTYTAQNMLLRLVAVYLNCDECHQLSEHNERKSIAENLLYLLDLMDIIGNYH